MLIIKRSLLINLKRVNFESLHDSIKETNAISLSSGFEIFKYVGLKEFTFLNRLLKLSLNVVWQSFSKKSRLFVFVLVDEWKVELLDFNASAMEVSF